MPATPSLIAALVACLSGFAVIRTVRYITANGLNLQSGGGWVVLLALEMTVNLSAVGVALS